MLDEHRRRLEERELPGTDEMPGRRIERQVQGDDVGASQDLSEKAEADPEGVLGVLVEARDVVVLDGHSECAGEARRLLADRAEPHEAEGAPAQLVHARRLVAAPPPASHVSVLKRQPPADGEHQQQGVLGHRHRVRAPVVGDGYAGAPRRFDVRAVVAGAQELDEPELRRGAVQLFVDEPVHESHEVPRLGDRGTILGASRRHPHELEAGGRELPHCLAVVEGRIDVHDSGGHSVPLFRRSRHQLTRAGGTSRRSAATRDRHAK